MKSNFDLTTFWKDQSTVTLYHGTSRRRLSSILEHGLAPSTIGYTKGKVYFTPSPEQARGYAHMDGEIESGGKARIDTEQTVVIEVKIPPELLILAGGGSFKTREKFMEHQALILDHFENGDRLTLQFEAEQIIPPSMFERIEEADND